MNETAVLSPVRGSVSEDTQEPDRPHLLSSPQRAWVLLLLVFLAVHAAALLSPSLLDDADATHALAAQHMARSGDWVTSYVNGVRYLEKPPLPYWLVAMDYKLFGYNVFATHLPTSLAVLACAVLGWFWARRAYGDRAAFYTALSMLTTIGVFLFTRTLIPEALLTSLLGLALYAFLIALEDHRANYFYVCYASLALAVLAKGLIAPLFFLGAAIPYLVIMGEWRRWREFRLLTGVLLFLAIAAPWHVLAAIRNPDYGSPHGNVPSFGHVHGFLYFYFMNEHVLRFLGLRYPHDYNKQPWWIFWAGHVAWLFPWCMFFPAALQRGWKNRRLIWSDLRGDQRSDAAGTLHFTEARPGSRSGLRSDTRRTSASTSAEGAKTAGRLRFRARTGLLLSIYAGFILIFFSLSTNQEYYTFPAYLPILLITAGSLATIEQAPPQGGKRKVRVVDGRSAWLLAAHALFALLGIASACALGYGLWASRKLPFVADVGTLLAHRGVADYTLAMSHFFDLTGPSFAALRTPAVVAAVVLLMGPVVSLWLRRRGHDFEATVSVGFTAAVFLIAAHSALIRFQPLLSSRTMADAINSMAGPSDRLMIYGDLPNFSSVIFYTGRRAELIDGRTSSMIWGSFYPDAPRIFLEDADLLADWGHGSRHFLCVPPEAAEHVAILLAGRLVKVQELADRTLYTDRPL